MLLDLDKLGELVHYRDEEISLGELVFQVWNCWLWKSENQKYPIKIIPKKEWTSITTEFSEFDIISYEDSYGENEGEINRRFVLKTTLNNYYEMLTFESSWDGPEYEGPTPVYPKQTTIYVKKEDY